MKVNALEGLEKVQPTAFVEVEQSDLHVGEDDGLVVKRIVLKRGQLAAQHTHAHSHVTIVGAGVVRVWRDGKVDRDYVRGSLVQIKAGVAHAFFAHEDSELYCVHAEKVVITAENKVEA